MDVEAARAAFLVGLIERYAERDRPLLEVGCRNGRNMMSLYQAGFRNLTGIESTCERLLQMEGRHPEMSAHSRVLCGDEAEVLSALGDCEFDLVFTVGFFEQPGADYSPVWDGMARVARLHVVTIEDERPAAGASDYRAVFESRGFIQVMEKSLSALTELKSDFTARAFMKP